MLLTMNGTERNPAERTVYPMDTKSVPQNEETNMRDEKQTGRDPAARGQPHESVQRDYVAAIVWARSQELVKAISALTDKTPIGIVHDVLTQWENEIDAMARELLASGDLVRAAQIDTEHPDGLDEDGLPIVYGEPLRSNERGRDDEGAKL